MKTFAWNDLNHKIPAARRQQIKQEAIAELDRMGFAALRKARRQTQVELAARLGIDQAGVSAIENRSDLLLSTLARYVRALGGNVEIRAVFPEASFNLEPVLGEQVELRPVQQRRTKPPKATKGSKKSRETSAVQQRRVAVRA